MFLFQPSSFLVLFLVCDTVTHVEGVLSSCLQGNVDISENRSCVLLSSSLATWQNAWEFCRYFGGDFISIINEAEQQDLEQLILLSNDERSHGFWIGLNDIQLPDNLVWTDKSQVNYTNWQLQTPLWDPQNYNGSCIYLNAEFQWSNANCSLRKGFICNEYSPAFNDSTGCDEGMHRFGESCYWMNSQIDNWNTSELWCQSEGGHLVTISSEIENLFVSTVVMNDEQAVWIGLIKTNNSQFPQWITQETLNYSNWDNDPNLSDELCGMIGKNGLWIMQPCSSLHQGAICEKIAHLMNMNTETLTPVVIPNDRPKILCPVGWERVNNRCYLINENKALTWSESFNFCHSFGGNLASFDSSRDENLVFQSNKSRNPNEFPDFWIGLHCDDIRPMGSWMDGSTLSYDQHDALQVQDMKNANPDTKLCVAHAVSTGKWQCLPCNAQIGSVCSLIFPNQEVTTQAIGYEGHVTEVTSNSSSESGYTAECSGKEGVAGCGTDKASEDLCPEAWNKLGSKCYLIQNQNLSWTSARDECTSFGKSFDLVSIHSKSEQAFIDEIMEVNQISEAWIGLNDIDTEGVFVWSDGGSFNYNLIKINRRKQMMQDCVSTINAAWIVVECELDLPYICQKVLPQYKILSTNKTTPMPQVTPTLLQQNSSTNASLSTNSIQEFTTQSTPNIQNVSNNSTEQINSTEIFEEVIPINATIVVEYEDENDTASTWTDTFTVQFTVDAEVIEETLPNISSTVMVSTTTVESTEDEQTYPDTWTAYDTQTVNTNSDNVTEDSMEDDIIKSSFSKNNNAEAGISGGTIAGIVIGTLILAGLLASSLIYFYTKSAQPSLLKDIYSFDNTLYNPEGDHIHMEPDPSERR